MYDETINIFLKRISETHYNKNNIVNLGINKWIRYRKFLDIILERYKKINGNYINIFNEMMGLIKEKADKDGKTEEDSELKEKNILFDNFTLCLHLEIESFYVFAKILLDRIADTFLYFFEIKPPEFASSHSEITTKIGKIISEKNLKLPVENFQKQIKELKEKITDYRTKQIEHSSELRKTYGTTWFNDGKAKISSNLIFPSNLELKNISKFQKTSDDPVKLLIELDNYIENIIVLFSDNIEKSTIKT